MKTLILAALAVVATVAPLHAKKVKPQAFTVAHVTIASPNGQIPGGAAVFKEGSTVMLTITKKKLTGPKKISLPIKTKSITSDYYIKTTGTSKSISANVQKNTSTQKPINVDLSFTGPVKIFGNITSAGLVTYTLVPKKSKK